MRTLPHSISHLALTPLNTEALLTVCTSPFCVLVPFTFKIVPSCVTQSLPGVPYKPQVHFIIYSPHF